MDTQAVETALGHTFANRSLLEEALTHSTWLKEANDKGHAIGLRDQQRLEFLGDAFLGYTVGAHFYDSSADATPASLTNRRTELVKGDFIRALGEQLHLNGLVRLGRGETRQLDRNNKVCEDTVEALVGAVLLDGGEEAAHQVVRRLFLSQGGEVTPGRDAITKYTHWWQEKSKRTAPKVTCHRVGGTDDKPVWLAKAELPNGSVVEALGGSKSEARYAACEKALASWDRPAN